MRARPLSIGISLRSCEVHGFEALIRWKHPVRDDLVQARFITPLTVVVIPAAPCSDPAYNPRKPLCCLRVRRLVMSGQGFFEEAQLLFIEGKEKESIEVFTKAIEAGAEIQ